MDEYSKYSDYEVLIQEIKSDLCKVDINEYIEIKHYVKKIIERLENDKGYDEKLIFQGLVVSTEIISSGKEDRNNTKYQSSGPNYEQAISFLRWAIYKINKELSDYTPEQQIRAKKDFDIIDQTMDYKKYLSTYIITEELCDIQLAIEEISRLFESERGYTRMRVCKELFDEALSLIIQGPQKNDDIIWKYTWALHYAQLSLNSFAGSKSYDQKWE